MKGTCKRFLSFPLLLFVTGCSTSPKISPHEEAFLRFYQIANNELQKANYRKALSLYLQALREARKADDSEKIADTAYNAALCYIVLGDYEASESLLKEALYELRRLGKSPVQIYLVQAAVAIRKKDWGRLDRLLNVSENSLHSKQAPNERCLIQLLKAEAACLRNDLSEAEAALNEAKLYLEEVEDPLIKARAFLIEGKLLCKEQSYLAAAEKYDRAASIYRKLENWRNMATCLEGAAFAYKHTDRAERAVDRAYRAARTLYALGETTHALSVLQSFLPPHSDQKDLKKVYAPLIRLFKEIRSQLKEENPENSGDSRK